jgi:hypothetical protein
MAGAVRALTRYLLRIKRFGRAFADGAAYASANPSERATMIFGRRRDN